MHPVQFIKQQQHNVQPQAANHSFNPGGNGIIRRWLGQSIRKWQQRKMIAALHRLDDRILRDIGLERGDIESIVREFNDYELRMVPLAAPSLVQPEQALRRAA
jgi:uncharacterized protein YjiS (DUF1127 family)